MNINKVKELVLSNMNKKIDFKLNGSRNQIEEFSGIIMKMYKSIFIIKVNNTDILKSFAYTDILIGNLELKVQNVLK